MTVGTQPALCATKGSVTTPGPVVLQIKRQRPPQNEISLATVVAVTAELVPVSLDPETSWSCSWRCKEDGPESDRRRQRGPVREWTLPKNPLIRVLCSDGGIDSDRRAPMLAVVDDMASEQTEVGPDETR